MPFHTEVMVVLMVFMTVVIAVEIAVHTVVTVVWIVFSTEETAVEMAVQMVLKVVWILVRTRKETRNCCKYCRCHTLDSGNCV